jgi:hypothetical protein
MHFTGGEPLRKWQLGRHRRGLKDITEICVEKIVVIVLTGIQRIGTSRTT